MTSSFMGRCVLVVACVAGCTKPGPPPDPELSRLQPGTEAIVSLSVDQAKEVADGSKQEDAVLADRAVAESNGNTWIRPKLGVKVRVVSDTAPIEKPGLDGYRKVTTGVLEGEYSGVVVLFARHNLRPVPR